MSRHRFGVVVVALLLAAGCSPADPSPPTTSTAPTSTAPTPTVAAASATPSPTPSVLQGTVPVADCLKHRYRLTGFTVLSGSGPYVSGTGGAVAIAFTGGLFPDGAYIGTHFTLTGSTRPLAVRTPDGAGKLVVSGRLRGTYTLAGSEAIFTQDTVRGTTTSTVGGTRNRRKLAEAAAFLAPDGPMEVVCTQSLMQLSGTDVVLDLRRT